MTRVIKNSLTVHIPSYDPLDDLVNPVNLETMKRIAVPMTSMMADLIAYADGKLTSRQLHEALAVFEVAVLELQEPCTGCDGMGCPACGDKGWQWRDQE